MAILMWGGYMVLKGQLDTSFLITLSIIHIVICFINVFVSLMVPRVQGSMDIFPLLESI